MTEVRTHYSWSREVAGKKVPFGTLVVLVGEEARVYLHVQVEDDHYDGVLEPDDLQQLIRTVLRFEGSA